MASRGSHLTLAPTLSPHLPLFRLYPSADPYMKFPSHSFLLPLPSFLPIFFSVHSTCFVSFFFFYASNFLTHTARWRSEELPRCNMADVLKAWRAKREEGKGDSDGTPAAPRRGEGPHQLPMLCLGAFLILPFPKSHSPPPPLQATQPVPPSLPPTHSLTRSL